MNAFYRRRKRWLIILTALVALMALFTVAPARAADTRGGDTIVIGRDEVIGKDLYVAGNTVTIDGTIKGDLVAVASQVTINGTVTGDVLAAAQGVVINGTVGDDVRAAGQAILLGSSARVGGDLAVGGLSLENQAGSAIDGDLLIGAYQALLSGAIGKNIQGGLDRLELRGTVGGNVDVAVGGDQGASAVQFSPAGQTPIPSVAPNLTVADSARIGGKLNYHSSAEARVGPAAQIAGGVAFDRQPAASTTTPTGPAIPGLNSIRRLAGLLLVGLLLLWLLPAWTRRLADTVETRPLPSLGWGVIACFAFLAAVITILVATIALAILLGYLTLGGLVGMILSLGLLAGAVVVVSYIAFAAYGAAIVVGFMAGRWLLRRAQPAWAEQPIVPLMLGLMLYVVVRAIPWLGGLVGLLVVLLALGALWQWGRTLFQRSRPTPAPLGGLQPV